MNDDRELVRRIIAGLRDTAAKCDSKRIVQGVDAGGSGFAGYRGMVQTQDYEVEAFSRDWISGRLLGMADMAEALIAKPDHA